MFIPLNHSVPPGHVEKPLSFRRDKSGRFRDVTGVERDAIPDSAFDQDPRHDGAQKTVIRRDESGRVRRFVGIVRRLPPGTHPNLDYLLLRRLLPEHLDNARQVAAIDYEMSGHYDVETLLGHGLVGPGEDVGASLDGSLVWWVVDELLGLVVPHGPYNHQTLAAHLFEHESLPGHWVSRGLELAFRKNRDRVDDTHSLASRGRNVVKKLGWRCPYCVRYDIPHGQQKGLNLLEQEVDDALDIDRE